MKDVDIRRALSLAIDRTGINEAVFEGNKIWQALFYRRMFSDILRQDLAFLKI